MANKAKSDTTKNDAKTKAKRQTTASLKKEIESLKANNVRLLNEIGNLSAMYMNSLSENMKSSRGALPKEKEVVVMATKRLIAFLMKTYGFEFSDLTN